MGEFLGVGVEQDYAVAGFQEESAEAATNASCAAGY